MRNGCFEAVNALMRMVAGDDISMLDESCRSEVGSVSRMLSNVDDEACSSVNPVSSVKSLLHRRIRNGLLLSTTNVQAERPCIALQRASRAGCVFPSALGRRPAGGVECKGGGRPVYGERLGRERSKTIACVVARE